VGKVRCDAAGQRTTFSTSTNISPEYSEASEKWVKKMNNKLTVDVEDVVEYFRNVNQMPKKSEIMNALNRSVEVTRRGLFNVKTKAGVLTLSTKKLHDLLGQVYVNYVNDDFVTENYADIVDKNKKNLPVNLH
jgi:hypothetical protein